MIILVCGEMVKIMELINKFRGVVTLLMVPFVTVAASLALLIGIPCLGISTDRAQAVPRWWARVIIGLCGVRVEVEGVERLPLGQPFIFGANHQSQYDIYSLQGFLGVNFRWLAKKELFQIPFLGSAMRYAGCIPIDRARGRQAMGSLGEAARRISAGTSVVIFPEGTRSRDGQMQAFKSGGMVLAIKSGVPVVPVAIMGSHEVLPKGELVARPGVIRIRVGTPIETKSYSVKQKQELANRLQAEVAALMA